MINISKSEISLMLEVLDLSNALRQQLEEIDRVGGKLADDVADDRRDACTARLDTNGFDEDYKPTKEGEILEHLIDKLFI